MCVSQTLSIFHPAVNSHPSLQSLLLSERTGRQSKTNPNAAAGYSFSLSMTGTFPRCSVPIKSEILAQGIAPFMMQGRPGVQRPRFRTVY